MADREGPLATVQDLTVAFGRRGERTEALRGVSLEVGRGEILAVVGESGSGKTVLGLSLLGLLPERPSPEVGGAVRVAGTDMVHGSEKARRLVRRRHLGAVFQDPMSSLNPSMRVGRQIVEAAPGADPVALLERVGLDRAAERVRSYPHELSGGQRQRVMIAIAIARQPSLVIADEPTTALDVTVQAQVLGLVRELRRDLGCSFLFVTHDLGVAADLADRVIVLYAGRVMESGPMEQVMRSPQHPYTTMLLGSRIGLTADRSRRLPALSGAVPGPDVHLGGCLFAPRCPLRVPECDAGPPPLRQMPGGSLSACIRPGLAAGLAEGPRLQPGAPATDLLPTGGGGPPLVSLQGVTKVFSVRSRSGKVTVPALAGIDLEVQPGEAVAVVGESGSGKSTLLRVVARLLPLSGGSMTSVPRGAVQMVFQDAASSLTPWLDVASLVKERLRLAGTSRRAAEARARDVLSTVGLGPETLARKPRQLSGGQAQRVAIARAIAVPPKLLLADEPTSALDVSVAATVLNLLGDLRRQLGFGLIFVTHDLAVARMVADRVVVMLRGRIVEQGDADRVISAPEHPYTRALLDAVPGRAREGDPAVQRVVR